MTYKQACETFRFARRNEHFVWLLFGFVMGKSATDGRPASKDRLAMTKDRKWCRKPLKSLETDSQMAIRRFGSRGQRESIRRTLHDKTRSP
jgi:hypothetical protein